MNYSASTAIQDRVSFVRSVYAWLMGGFVVAGVGAISAPFAAALLFPLLGRFFILALILVFYGTFFWANAVSRRKPQNRFAYAAFTFVAGILAGFASIAAATQSGPGIVLAALGMTAADFLVLSLVALVSKKDFGFLGGFITTGLVIALVGSLIGIFLHVELLHLMISAVIVIACSAKILYDTSLMLRNGDTGDAAGFALSLFVSLLNIFLSILRLLGGRRD
ncbi:Bax inhibitor-1/YccA family protein [Holophaga foetida]|uniref:Bax inhibitor-1/YccA family protein n=1 Tax=Holophaga foetida TaxID=35839 RepID=UPI0002472F34|nr:Bax inhibitor-1 family protein [Holophaga foetida]